MHRVVIVFAVAAAVLMGVFSMAERYAEDSAVPRYCKDKIGVVGRVGDILTNGRPVGQGQKRPYIIAAKLIFLVPQTEAESVPGYLDRLQRHLDKVCRGR